MASKTGTEKGYSISALARMAGVDRRTLASRLEGVTPLESGPKGKLYRLSDVVRNFITQPLQGEAEDPALLALRARKLEAEAGLAELKLARERGEVVDHHQVLGDMLTLFREFHTCFTVAVPQRLAPLLRVARPAREAEEILRAEMERSLYEVRTEHAQYLGDGGEAEGSKGEGADDDEA